MQFQGHRKLRILISKEEILIVIKYFYHLTMFPIKSNDRNNSHREFPLPANMDGVKRFPYLRFHIIANEGSKVL